jgi:adenylate cyclase
MSFVLEIKAGEIKGRSFPIVQSPLTVGRQEGCEIILANDELVSRKHACFSIENNTCLVENLGSLNGVFVNGKPIEKKMALKPEDEVIIGNHLFVLKNKPGTPTPQSSQQDAVRRLHLLYQLQRASTGTNATDDLLNMFLKLIFQDLRVNRGCIYILDPNTQRMEAVCFRIRGQNPDQSSFQPNTELLNHSRGQNRAFLCNSAQLKDSQLTLGIGVPLMEGNNKIGLIYLDSNHQDFQPLKGDLEFLEALSQQAVTALINSRLTDQLKNEKQLINRLAKHVDPKVVQRLREQKVDLEFSSQKTEERETTILFSDIVGFTSLSEKLSANEIAFLLNGYFNHMEECVRKYHGYLNKYIGDAVMAVFGAPESAGNDAQNAVCCGLEMLEKLKIYWKTIDEMKRFKIRIGINTGLVTAGNIGSLERMEYTVIGDAVNLASRLESKAQPMSVLIGESTYSRVKNAFPLQPLGSINVKGKEKPVQIFKVSGSIGD